ncbi:MAG: hypothetical protein IKC69_06875 [Clostridia bacterium]|nr:hypothetical protein [Clostridia bacterium]
MKRILALLLALFTLIPLASCASEINPPAYEEATATVTDTEAGETTPVVTPEKPAETEEVKKETEKIDENYNYPEVHDKLSWEKINSFPIANSNMSTDELRQLCVDFFRFTKTFAWTPSSTYKFQKNEKGSKDSIDKGSVYGGLPYVGLGSGSVYRVMDYYDPETGILMIQSAGEDRYLFGNQCSIGAYWGWGRVINSAKYRWTYDAVVANGFVRVGPYTYKDDLAKFDSFSNTVLVCKNNGRETMYESYAQLQPADGLVYYTSAGHIIMCSSKAHVVRMPTAPSTARKATSTKSTSPKAGRSGSSPTATSFS